jgi:6-phosphogluconolactonase
MKQGNRIWLAAVSLSLAAGLACKGHAPSAGSPRPGAEMAGLEPFVYVGGWPLSGTSTPREITIYRLDLASGRLTAAGTAAGPKTPTFMAFHPGGKFAYVIDEVDDGKVYAYAIDPATGALTLLNSASAAGFGPTHMALDRSAKFVLTASWAGDNPASIGVVPILPDGKVGEPVDRKDFMSKGYAHYVTTSPDNKFVLANLNGEQATALFRFDAATGKLTPNDPPRVTYPAGYGPRHLDFHPSGKFVYVIHEQGAKITAHRYDSAQGTLTQLQEVPTLPEGFTGANTTAQILVHPSGKFVYGSNRGHDSVVIYRIDETTGMLSLVGHQTGVGARPRNFTIDPTGALLLAASQDEHNVRVYRIDQTTGQLQLLGDPQPVGYRPSFVGVLFLPGR